MKPILGALVHYKQTNRGDDGIRYAFVAGFNGDKVNLNLFSLGTMTYQTNVTVADSAETAEVGQCWVPKQS